MKAPKNRPWKVLKSEYVRQRPWCTVRLETLAMPDGRIVPEYYVFEYPDWVNVIATTRDGRLLLVSQYRHGLGETAYEIPAGCIEPADASPLAAAQRELKEETGYGGGRWRQLTVVAPNPATQNNRTYCFVAEGVERLGDQQLDATEQIDIYLVTRDEVLDLLRTDRIRQALMAAPLWRYLYEERTAAPAQGPEPSDVAETAEG